MGNGRGEAFLERAICIRLADDSLWTRLVHGAALAVGPRAEQTQHLRMRTATCSYFCARIYGGEGRESST
jgi:hypothetical protein